MDGNRFSAGLVLFALILMPLSAQEPPDEALPAMAAETGPCVVDRELSLWLTLEAIDRMIAALESDRRRSIEELASVRSTLDTIDRPQSVDENSLTALILKSQAADGGVDRLLTAYSELESRIVEIEKTLERRRAQQAAVEAKLETFLDEE